MGRKKLTYVYTKEDRDKVYDYYVHKFDTNRIPIQAGFSIEKLEKEIQEQKEKEEQI